MKTSRFSEAQRASIVGEQSSGKPLDEICRENQISPATFYKWKRELKENQDESKRELKRLREENARLKKLYSELMIDHDILKEGLEVAKKISARARKNN